MPAAIDPGVGENELRRPRGRKGASSATTARTRSGPFGRKRQRDSRAHRATHDRDGFFDHLLDKACCPVEIDFLSQSVGAAIPTGRRHRTAVLRHVESDQAPVAAEIGVAHDAV